MLVRLRTFYRGGDRGKQSFGLLDNGTIQRLETVEKLRNMSESGWWLRMKKLDIGMNRAAIRIIQFTRRHLTVIFVASLTILLFSIFSGFAIEEKGGLSRLWVGLVSFFTGVTAGGILGFVIGGIGIAAMGTAVGVPALAVAGIGALFGGLLFGSIGTGIGTYLSDPTRYEVSQIKLALILVVSLLVSYFVVVCIKPVIRWAYNRWLLAAQ